MARVIITFNIHNSTYDEYINKIISDLENIGAENIEVSAE